MVQIISRLDNTNNTNIFIYNNFRNILWNKSIFLKILKKGIKMEFLENIIQENTTKNKELLKEAYAFAETNSHDNSTRVGVVAVSKINKTKVYGANAVPNYESKEDVPEKLLERPLKYNAIKHAEENMILSSKEKGINLEESTVYLNWFPCYNCANLLTNSKISKLVFHFDMVDKTPKEWKTDLKKAYNHLKTKGIEMTYVKGTLGVPARMREKDWKA